MTHAGGQPSSDPGDRTCPANIGAALCTAQAGRHHCGEWDLIPTNAISMTPYGLGTVPQTSRPRSSSPGLPHQQISPAAAHRPHWETRLSSDNREFALFGLQNSYPCFLPQNLTPQSILGVPPRELVSCLAIRRVLSLVSDNFSFLMCIKF